MTATKPVSGSALDGYWNRSSTSRVQDNKPSPTQRASTTTELPEFFDHADDEVALIAASRRQGWLPAYRSAAMFKLAYSYHGSRAWCVERYYAVRPDPSLNWDIVQGNDVAVGSVCAKMRHRRHATDLLACAHNEWRERLIFRRVPLENADEAFQLVDWDVKAIIDLDRHR
jgi:hypothetical protein